MGSLFSPLYVYTGCCNSVNEPSDDGREGIEGESKNPSLHLCLNRGRGRADEGAEIRFRRYGLPFSESQSGLSLFCSDLG